EAVGAAVGGDFGPGKGATTGAGAAVGLVFNDLRGQGRQFGDLMPARFGVIRGSVGGQGRVAAAAVGGQEGDGGGGAVGGLTVPQLRRVSGLGARLLAGGLLGDGLGSLGRVGRRGRGGIGGIGAEAGGQVADQRL